MIAKSQKTVFEIDVPDSKNHDPLSKTEQGNELRLEVKHISKILWNIIIVYAPIFNGTGGGGGVSPAKNGRIENCQTMRGGRKILGMIWVWGSTAFYICRSSCYLLKCFTVGFIIKRSFLTCAPFRLSIIFCP